MSRSSPNSHAFTHPRDRVIVGPPCPRIEPATRGQTGAECVLSQQSLDGLRVRPA